MPTTDVIEVNLMMADDDSAVLNIIGESDELISMQVDPSFVPSASKDYLELINKPSINGTTLVTNYDEIDPTVPSWAKAETKPTYTSEEVGALDEDAEMSFATVKQIWDSIFS